MTFLNHKTARTARQAIINGESFLHKSRKAFRILLLEAVRHGMIKRKILRWIVLTSLGSKENLKHLMHRETNKLNCFACIPISNMSNNVCDHMEIAFCDFLI